MCCTGSSRALVLSVVFWLQGRRAGRQPGLKAPLCSEGIAIGYIKAQPCPAAGAARVTAIWACRQRQCWESIALGFFLQP